MADSSKYIMLDFICFGSDNLALKLYRIVSRKIRFLLKSTICSGLVEDLQLRKKYTKKFM